MDLHGYHIPGGVYAGAHRHWDSLYLEAAVQRAVVEVELLINVGDILRARLTTVPLAQGKADAAQIQTMGIFPEPVVNLLVAGDLLLGVSHLAAIGVKGVEL